jgi:hypothetical protein
VAPLQIKSDIAPTKIGVKLFDMARQKSNSLKATELVVNISSVTCGGLFKEEMGFY